MSESNFSESLTGGLLKKYSPLFKRATEHTFLEAAGNGKLPADVLCQWLGQDIIYTRGYIRFMGSLVSRLRVPEKPSIHNASHNNELHLRVFNLLVGSITNIQQEIKFFDDNISKYSLDIKVSNETGFVKPEPVTQAYVDLFDSFGSPSHSLLEGVLTLWATEDAYLNAWKWAGSYKPANWQQLVEDQSIPVQQRNAMKALWEAFIPNWTASAFADFVEECRKVVDELWKAAKANSDGQESAAERDLLHRCERIYENVMKLEEGFWPSDFATLS